MKNRYFLLYGFPLLTFLLLLALLFVALRHTEGGEVSKFSQHLDEIAPTTNLSLLGAGDGLFRTEDWSGRAYVVNFFASWCIDCRAEHDSLKTMAQLSIPVIGIAFKDKASGLHEFLTREGNPYAAVAMDDNGRSGIDWGITGIPETFIVDVNGRIRFHYIGPLTEDVLTHEFALAWANAKKHIPQ